MRAVGIDVGGSSTKLAVTDNGQILTRAQCPTPLEDPVEFARAVSTLIRESASDWETLPIGLACAGDVNPASGLISADNLGWFGAPIGSCLRRALGRDVLLLNDCHAAMMAEWDSGSLRGERNALFLTLGTGVGGDAIVNGQPLRGMRPSAGEFGHMITHAGGEPCPCGERGCYERYASSAALVRRAPGYSDAKSVIEAARRADPEILPVWLDYIEEVASGLVGLISVFYPDAVSVGGGISAAGDFLLLALRDALGRHEGFRRYFSHVRISLAQYGNDAGVLGAAAAACRTLQ